MTAARKKIAAGASLRSAAAAIPCAASTLSTRIRKAEQAEAEAEAEADAYERTGIRANRPAQSGPDDGHVGPVEVLRGALQATKANGQPDWPTRVTAARALAALRPELAEPEPEREPSPLRSSTTCRRAAPLFCTVPRRELTPR